MNNGKQVASGKKDYRGGKFENKTDGKKNCSYCKFDGHVYEQCFERLGYPDWYKGKKVKRHTRMAAQVNANFDQNSPIDLDYKTDVNVEQGANVDQKLDAASCQEMMKMFKGMYAMQENVNSGSSSMNNAGTYYYQTSFSSSSSEHKMAHFSWIIDTGASNHMSPYLHLFHSLQSLKHPIQVKMSDGTFKIVTTIGHVTLTSSLTLQNVLFVPDFKFNLLSVGKLVVTQNLYA